MKPYKETRILFTDNHGNRQWLRCRDFLRHRYWQVRGYRRTKVRVRIELPNMLKISTSGKSNGGHNYTTAEIYELCEKEFKKIRGDYNE